MSAGIRGVRVAAVLLGASLAVLGAALPAGAGTQDDAGGVGATPSGTMRNASHVWLEGGQSAAPTGLIELRTDEADHTLWTYCVEQKVRLDPDEHMTSVSWDRYPGRSRFFAQNNDKVLWILQHSYPTVRPGRLAEQAGVPGLDATQAAAGTQAAIWHFSDGADLDKNTEGKHANDPAVVALYEYLTGAADVGADGQPAPSLSLTPNSVSGPVGGLVGPVQVTTNAKTITWTARLPRGVELTDAQGHKLDTRDVRNGSEIYFKVPAGADPATSASITGATRTTALPGQLFVNDHYRQDPSQSLILAEATRVTASDTATVTWTPAAAPSTSATPPPATTAPPTTSGAVAPPPSGAPGTPGPTRAPVSTASENDALAYTGVAIGLPVGIAALLLLGGGTLLLVRRRKGTRS